MISLKIVWEVINRTPSPFIDFNLQYAFRQVTPNSTAMAVGFMHHHASQWPAGRVISFLLRLRVGVGRKKLHVVYISEHYFPLTLMDYRSQFAYFFIRPHCTFQHIYFLAEVFFFPRRVIDIHNKDSETILPIYHHPSKIHSRMVLYAYYATPMTRKNLPLNFESEIQNHHQTRTRSCLSSYIKYV